MKYVKLKVLNKLKFQNSNKILNKIKSNSYEECVLARCTQHTNYEIFIKKSKDFLDLLNLFDPVYTENLKSEYFITFLNEYNKYLDAKVLSLKSMSKDTFIEFVTREQRQSGKKLKIIRVDNALEFNNINKLCIQNDILFQKIIPYAYEQTDAIERINLALLNKIRSMLFIAKLNKEF